LPEIKANAAAQDEFISYVGYQDGYGLDITIKTSLPKHEITLIHSSVDRGKNPVTWKYEYRGTFEPALLSDLQSEIEPMFKDLAATCVYLEARMRNRMSVNDIPTINMAADVIVKLYSMTIQEAYHDRMFGTSLTTTFRR
jgi:hypothetical protein